MSMWLQKDLYLWTADHLIPIQRALRDFTDQTVSVIMPSSFTINGKLARVVYGELEKYFIFAFEAQLHFYASDVALLGEKAGHPNPIIILRANERESQPSSSELSYAGA